MTSIQRKLLSLFSLLESSRLPNLFVLRWDKIEKTSNVLADAMMKSEMMHHLR